MYHFICLYQLNKNTIIAYHEANTDMEKIVKKHQLINKKCPNAIFSIHKFTLNKTNWNDVCKYDPYFKQCINIPDINNFINIITSKRNHLLRKDLKINQNNKQEQSKNSKKEDLFLYKNKSITKKLNQRGYTIIERDKQIVNFKINKNLKIIYLNTNLNENKKYRIYKFLNKLINISKESKK